MATRSSKLAVSIPIATISTTAYTVPAGMTVILKSVYMYNISATADTCNVSIQSAGGGTVQIVAQQSIPAPGAANWAGWVILGPGDIIAVKSTLGTTRFWLSGTVLVGVA